MEIESPAEIKVFVVQVLGLVQILYSEFGLSREQIVKIVMRGMNPYVTELIRGFMKEIVLMETRTVRSETKEQIVQQIQQLFITHVDKYSAKPFLKKMCQERGITYG